MDPPPQAIPDPADLLAKMTMLDSGGKDTSPLVADGKGEEVIIGTYTIPTFKNKGFNGNGNDDNHDDDKIRRRRRTREKLKANRMIKRSTSSSHEDGNSREQLNKKFSTKNRKESFNNNTMQEDDSDGGRMDSSDDWMENALLNGISAANEVLSLNKQPTTHRSSASVERTYTNSTPRPKQQSSQSSVKRFNRSRSSGAPAGGKLNGSREHLYDDTANLHDAAKVTAEQPRLTTVDGDNLITNPDVSIEDIIKLRRKYNPTTNSSFSSPFQEVESCPHPTTDTQPSNISTLPTIKTFKVTKNSPDETAGLFLRKASNGAILVHSLSPNSLFRKNTPLRQGHEVLSVNEKRVNDPKLAATLITQSKKHLSLRVSTFERCKGFFYCQVKRRDKKQQHNVEAGGKVTEEKTTAAASSGASSRRTSRIRTRGSTNNNNNNGGVRFVTTSIDGLRRGTGDGLVRVAHIDPDSQFANSEHTKNRLHVGCIILTVNGVPVTNARSALEKVMDSRQLIEVLHCDERVYRDDWVNVGLKQVLSGKIKDPMEIATSTFILDNKKNETDEGSVNNSNMWDLEWETNYKEVILREKKKRGSTAVNTNTSYAFKLIFDNNNGRCHPELVNYSTMMPPTDEFDVSLLVKIVNDLQRAVMTVLQNMLRTTKFDLKFGDGMRRQTGYRTQQKSNLRNIATATSREQLDAKQPDSPKRRQRIKSWDILAELIEEDYDGINEEPSSGNKHKSDIPRRGSVDAIYNEQKYHNQQRTDKVHEKARQYETGEQDNDTTTNRRLSSASNVSGSMFSTEMLDDFVDYLEDVSASLSAAGLDSVSTPSSNSSPSPPSSPRDSNSTQQISPSREDGNNKKSCDDDLAYITGVYRDVSSKYEISDEIVGSGGFGEVRDCVDTSTGALYVVKTILKPDPSDTTKINLIRNEILLLHEAHHPNIVTLKDLFEDDHYVHIVMERCTGGDLFDMVVRQNPRCFRSLTEAKKHEQRTANCMHSILKVLEYLHSKGIVHRDIKPEHFLLTTNDDSRAEIKLIDFGLARKHTQGTDPMTTFTGSPSFVAPEVIARKYDSQCDMFSVGVTAYFLLTGMLPFDGSTDEETFDLISDGVFSFPSTSLFLSNEAMDFITRLLETNPRKRLTAIKALRHPWIVQVVPI